MISDWTTAKLNVKHVLSAERQLVVCHRNGHRLFINRLEKSRTEFAMHFDREADNAARQRIIKWEIHCLQAFHGSLASCFNYLGFPTRPTPRFRVACLTSSHIPNTFSTPFHTPDQNRPA